MRKRSITDIIGLLVIVGTPIIIVFTGMIHGTDKTVEVLVAVYLIFFVSFIAYNIIRSAKRRRSALRK